MTLRIALIDDQTGECEIGGQRCKVVPVECIEDALCSLGAFCSDEGWTQEDMDNMDRLGAAAIDLSGLPRVEGDWTALFDGAAK